MIFADWFRQLKSQLESRCPRHSILVHIYTYTTVFQLGLFMRALRPARTGLSPARFTCALPQYKIKKLIYFLFLQNVIAVFVFSDSRCKNACKMLADLCPCFHQSPTRPNFGRSHVKDFVSFAHKIVPEFWSFAC